MRPLFQRDFQLVAFPARFRKKLPRWFTRQSKPEKYGGFLVGHVFCFRHNAFKDRAPDDKAVAARSAFLFG